MKWFGEADYFLSLNWLYGRWSDGISLSVGLTSTLGQIWPPGNWLVTGRKFGKSTHNIISWPPSVLDHARLHQPAMWGPCYTQTRCSATAVMGGEGGERCIQWIPRIPMSAPMVLSWSSFQLAQTHLPGFEKDTKWPQLAVSDQIVKTFIVFRSFVNLQGLALKTKTFKQEKTLHHCF